MEIMPSKFRSPPPKPPRRRHSDQLAISQSGTYPSSRKKFHDESKLCLKDAQIKSENSTGCGSLPANWITDFSSNNKMENSALFKSLPLNSLTHLKNTCANFQIPIDSVRHKDNSGLTDALMETDCKSNVNFEWTKKKELLHTEQVGKSSIFPLKFNSRNFLECCPNTGIESNTFDTPSGSVQKTYPREHHKRHHSDPLLSYLDRSNSKSGLQKYIFKGHSLLDSLPFDMQNKLSNSSNTSFEHKETQNLHEEIKTLKEINNKLWQHLCSTQACLEKAKKNSDENMTLSLSDLLSSLYCSQKAKDCAMEDRMKIILEERDTAVQELENLVQIIAGSFEDDTIEEEEKCSDKEIKDLLKEIEVTYNPGKLLQQQRLLLTYLYRSKELKQDHIIHELKLAVSEKNLLMEKVKYLEEELKSIKICNELWNSDNKHWENNLLNILCQVIQQRDAALSKSSITQNLEHISCRSANESSRVMEENTDEYECFQNHDNINISEVKRNFQSSPRDLHKYEQLSIGSMSDEIRLLKGEILVLNKALEMEAEKRESAEEKCLRLERLVNVLQRKVNGQNVGISV